MKQHYYTMPDAMIRAFLAKKPLPLQSILLFGIDICFFI